ncbi:hypothetical protein GCM10027162_24430 [Streptomyces incanus]
MAYVGPLQVLFQPSIREPLQPYAAGAVAGEKAVVPAGMSATDAVFPTALFLNSPVPLLGGGTTARSGPPTEKPARSSG